MLSSEGHIKQRGLSNLCSQGQDPLHHEPRWHQSFFKDSNILIKPNLVSNIDSPDPDPPRSIRCKTYPHSFQEGLGRLPHRIIGKRQGG